MRKISIALRRLGTLELPSLSRGELRSFQRDLLDQLTGSGDASADPEPESEEKEIPEADTGSSVDQEFGLSQDVGKREVIRHSDQGKESPKPAGTEVTASKEGLVVTADGESGTLRLFPHDVSGDGGFSATFQLSSLSDSEVEGRLLVYSHGSNEPVPGAQNSEDAVLSLGLPVNGLIRLSQTKFDADALLVALGSSAEEVADLVSVEEAFDFMPNILEDEPGRRLAIPIEVASSISTTLVYGNPTGSPVEVRCFLIDEQGRKVAEVRDPRLNPLPAEKQIAQPVETYFETLKSDGRFKGSVVAEIVGKGSIQCVALVGTESDSETSLCRRALNMNINLEELKRSIAGELEQLKVREELLREQISHLEAVQRFMDGYATQPDTAGEVSNSFGPASPTLQNPKARAGAFGA